MTSSDFVVSPSPQDAESIETKSLVDEEDVVTAKSKETVAVQGIPLLILQNCIQFYPEDPTKSKMVSYDDFVDLLTSSLKKEDSSEKVGQEYWLPQGTFFFSVHKTKIKICCYYPETKKEITYGRSKALRVVPNIIISVVLEEKSKLNVNFPWAVADVRYLCTKTPLNELPREFYAAPKTGFGPIPFSNVYSNGTLCFGANVKPGPFKLPDFRGIHGFYQLLFDSPFNNDLGMPGVGSNYSRDIGGWFDFLATLAEQDKPFPYKELSHQ